jgi:uncharacterized protein
MFSTLVPCALSPENDSHLIPLAHPNLAGNGLDGPSRRQWLRGSLGLLAGALTGGVCLGGGEASSGSTPKQTSAVVKVEFIGMPAPATMQEAAEVFSTAAVRIHHANGSTHTESLRYHTLYHTGQVLPSFRGATVVAGGYFDLQNRPVLDNSVSPAVQAFSDGPDGQSLLSLPEARVSGVRGNTLFLVTQFEYLTADQGSGGQRPTPPEHELYGRLPSQIAVATLDQDPASGELRLVRYTPVETRGVHGLWITCAASLSPWNTHLASEEYEPDAVHGTGHPMFQAFSRNLHGHAEEGSLQMANPYHYGHVPEVTVHPDGTGTIRKHYGLGRIARELVEVLPDQRTVLMGNDGTNSGLFMFVADRAADLSVGTLYAARWTQTSIEAGGAGTLSWIRLGHARSEEIEALADRLKAADIVSVRLQEPSEPGFTRIACNGRTEWVRFVPGQEQAAAFLETHRYAALRGASLEFTKMEGVALNPQDRRAYVAVSYLNRTMSDAQGDIRLPPIQAGAVFELVLSGAQTDTQGRPIASDWVPTAMQAMPDLVGEDLRMPDAVGNTAHVDRIANPDNLKYSSKLRTLFIGEDSSMHVNNFLWAYQLDSRQLSRLLSAPAGAEVTGLQVVENQNGHAYLMSNFQHTGDWLPIHAGLKGRLDALVNERWQTKRSAAVGYLSGLPAL